MKLNNILEQTVPGLGYELVDVEMAPSKTIRIFIDKDGGVTIDDCEKVSNHLTKLLFVEEIDFNRLEVSSPGLERPLKKLEDYVRFKGKLAKIKTREVLNGEKVFQGVLHGVVEERVQLMQNDKLIEIEFANINRCRLVFDDYKKNNLTGKKG